ncbi:MAG: hydantoinase B/oxoprolinase family protein [Parvibaculales bacterium]
MSQQVDPVTLQVIDGALHTIAAEMGHVLYRMSYSSIIRESQDLGAGLFDAEGNTLCESDTSPLHIGSIPGYLRGIAETMSGEWKPGDIVIHNHPYYGASHSPDICVVMPVFFDGELVGFSANTAHHVDIGAATPGLIIDIPDVYAEGMLFKGVKLYEEGVRNEAIWKYFLDNTRTPYLAEGDIEAQIAAVKLGAKHFLEMFEQYGKETMLTSFDQLMTYTENLMRAEIAKIPDGEYRAEGFLDDNGQDRDKTVPVKVCVKIKGDSVEVDLTGSAEQAPTAMNVPFDGSTKPAAFFAFRALLLDPAVHDVHLPANEGSFRPISVTAPEGTIFNPRFPAAAEARFTQCQRMIDLIYKALADVLPEKSTAGNSASLSFISFSGILPDSNDYWVFLEVNGGAYGGRPESDGPDSIDNLMANVRNNPIEDLGMHLPLICDRYELRDDIPPGPGKTRGGIGLVRSQRFLTDGIITHESDRHLDTPWGLFGGGEGATGKVEVYNIADPGNRDSLHAKFSGVQVKKGDVVEISIPNGGGYGSPLERAPEQVRDDVLDGFYCRDHAKEAYGVILNEACDIDADATAKQRAQMQA